jgi:hypothetical protein
MLMDDIFGKKASNAVTVVRFPLIDKPGSSTLEETGAARVGKTAYLGTRQLASPRGICSRDEGIIVL